MSAGLTRAVIVSAALDLLDEGGMDGLTVRALAARLGVQAPALYWHVASKQALLDEMATAIWREIGETVAELPAGMPWRDLMTAYAGTVREGLLRHRDGARAFSGTTLTDPEVVRRQEGSYERLVSQGFSLPDAARALLLLHDFTIGFCIEEQAVGQALEAGNDAYRPGRRAEAVGADLAPLAVAAGDIIFGDRDIRFGELLSLLLDGVAQLRENGAGGTLA